MKQVHEAIIDGINKNPKLLKETEKEYFKNIAQLIAQLPYLIGDDYSIKVKQEKHEFIYNELTFNKNSAPLTKFRGTLNDNQVVEDDITKNYDLILLNNKLEVMSQI